MHESAARAAALKALADYTGVSDPEKPWWNLDMPKALDIMLPAIQDALAAEPLVQVGWMLSLDLAAEFDMTPLSDNYLITLEQAAVDGGIKDEFQSRVIPIYRKASDGE